MAVRPTVTAAEGLGKELMAASPDLLGSMVKAFAEALMGAEADGSCKAEYGEISPGCEWDTRAGTIELAVPKLRGVVFSGWLLTRRRRAEQALTSVVATSHLLGVSTRRVDKLVEQLGVAHIPKIAGVGDGEAPRRPGRGVPPPATGRRPVPVRPSGRVDDEGP